MPVNNFTFSAFRSAVNTDRVASCHAPWGNGQAYWDTGGTGYDRINKALPAEFQKGQWVHWAFTKDCDTREVYIYVNGEVFHSGTGMTKPMTGVIAFAIGVRAFDHAQGYQGRIDDFRLYDTALTEAQIQSAMIGIPPGAALGPKPSDKATDVPREAILSWTQGKFAATHDVYLGTVFADVNNASRTNPRGVLASQG